MIGLELTTPPPLERTCGGGARTRSMNQPHKYRARYTGLVVEPFAEGRSLPRTWEVLVATPAMVLAALESGALSWVSLRLKVVVFDEAHHACGAHPYALLARSLVAARVSPAPRVLGLTASLTCDRPARVCMTRLEFGLFCLGWVDLIWFDCMLIWFGSVWFGGMLKWFGSRWFDLMGFDLI